MTRKRTRESLAHMLCEPCPTCQGNRGQVKTARSVLLRHPARDPARGAQFNPGRSSASSPRPAVVEMLLDEEASTRRAVRVHRRRSAAGRPGRIAGTVRHRPPVVARAVPPAPGWTNRSLGAPGWAGPLPALCWPDRGTRPRTPPAAPAAEVMAVGCVVADLQCRDERGRRSARRCRENSSTRCC